MSRISTCVGLEAAGPINEDCARVVEAGDVQIMAVADGVGGVRGSVHAAGAVVGRIGTLVDGRRPFDREATWVEFLAEVDAAIHQVGNWGHTTAIVLAATDAWICGASVGDSEAWLATSDGHRHVTSRQNHRPLVGSGVAKPVPFRRDHAGGSLILGTDGLFKFAPAWQICQIVVDHPPEDACRLLIELVRLRVGRLRDDIGVVVCKLPGRGEARTPANPGS